MKTMTKILTVAAALVVALSLAAPVSANCGTTAIISSITPGGTSFIYGPTWTEFGIYQGAYGPAVYSYYASVPVPLPISAQGSITFWALGSGDPAVGVGDDNGGYDIVANGGFYFEGYLSGSYLPGGYIQAGKVNATWEGGTDACVGPNNCMCVLISDQDGNRGFWAVAGGMSDPNVNTVINRGGADGNGNNLPIQMVEMDAPQILGSVRQPNFDVDFSVSVPAPAGGSYAVDGCACAPLGFKVLQQIVPRGTTPPSDRNAGVWTEPQLVAGGAQGVTPFGGSVAVRSACGASDTDVWLTTQLMFDSGFGTTVVSGNSTRAECGPNLADPGDDKPRGIRPRSDRPTPRRR